MEANAPGTEPAAQTETAATAEPRRERAARHARRARAYFWAILLVAFLVFLVALVLANRREVRLSWVFGSTQSSLIWIIVASAIIGWVIGLATASLLRRRTRRTVGP